MTTNRDRPGLADWIVRRPWLFMLVALGLWGLNFLALPIMATVEKSGSLGDAFGLTNALFSALAFAALLYAILLQREELALQRRELELTREELAGQKEQLLQQNRTMARQRFENTFFAMLQVHRDLLNSIRHQSGSIEFMGVSALVHDYGEVTQKLPAKLSGVDEQGGVDKWRKEYDSAFAEFWKGAEGRLGPYARNLLEILRYVDAAEGVDVERYADIVRAQLSMLEMALLAYYCLSEHGLQSLRPLAAKHDLFRHLPNWHLRYQWAWRYLGR